MSERAPSSESGLILSHGDLGPAGLLGEWLAERGRPYQVHDVAHGPMPPLGHAPFVASLGSERSATDASLAWVAAELELLREAVASSVPVLGLCFGGQALAIAVGGEVARARAPQIGWFELSGAGVPRGPWFHWHYEQFAPPAGAEVLAYSDVGPAAFRMGPHLGLQFHPEVTVEVIEGWSRSVDQLAKVGVDPAALVAESVRRAGAARADAWQLFDMWLAGFAGDAGRSSA